MVFCSGIGLSHIYINSKTNSGGNRSASRKNKLAEIRIVYASRNIQTADGSLHITNGQISAVSPGLLFIDGAARIIRNNIIGIVRVFNLNFVRRILF
jgi:hypothetical protein